MTASMLSRNISAQSKAVLTGTFIDITNYRASDEGAFFGTKFSDYFWSLSIKVLCCDPSSELPYQGSSNERPQYMLYMNK